MFESSKRPRLADRREPGRLYSFWNPVLASRPAFDVCCRRAQSYSNRPLPQVEFEPDRNATWRGERTSRRLSRRPITHPRLPCNAVLAVGMRGRGDRRFAGRGKWRRSQVKMEKSHLGGMQSNIGGGFKQEKHAAHSATTSQYHVLQHRVSLPYSMW